MHTVVEITGLVKCLRNNWILHFMCFTISTYMQSPVIRDTKFGATRSFFWKSRTLTLCQGKSIFTRFRHCLTKGHRIAFIAFLKKGPEDDLALT